MSNTIVGKAFDEAKKLYDQNQKTFYVSLQDIMIDGKHTYLHKAILQPQHPKHFTEFIPGNVDDTKRIYESFAKKKTFQSYYCGLCASGEQNNVIDFAE